RGACAQVFRVVEQPLDLRARKVRVEHKPRLLADRVFKAARLQLVAGGGSPPVLPHDRAGDRSARRALPSDDRLALVRDADGAQIARLDARGGESFRRGAKADAPNLL